MIELGVIVTYDDKADVLSASVGSDQDMKDIPKDLFQSVVASATVGLIDQYFDKAAPPEMGRMEFFEETLRYIRTLLEDRYNKKTTLETLRYIVDKFNHEDRLYEVEEISKCLERMESKEKAPNDEQLS